MGKDSYFALLLGLKTLCRRTINGGIFRQLFEEEVSLRVVTVVKRYEQLQPNKSAQSDARTARGWLQTLGLQNKQ